MKTMSLVRSRRWAVKLFLFIIVLCMALAVTTILLYLKGANTYLVDEESYQYFLQVKQEYPAKTRLIAGQKGLIVQVEDRRNAGEQTPVY